MTKLHLKYIVEIKIMFKFDIITCKLLPKSITNHIK